VCAYDNVGVAVVLGVEVVDASEPGAVGELLASAVREVALVERDVVLVVIGQPFEDEIDGGAAALARQHAELDDERLVEGPVAREADPMARVVVDGVGGRGAGALLASLRGGDRHLILGELARDSDREFVLELGEETREDADVRELGLDGRDHGHDQVDVAADDDGRSGSLRRRLVWSRSVGVGVCVGETRELSLASRTAWVVSARWRARRTMRRWRRGQQATGATTSTPSTALTLSLTQDPNSTLREYRHH